MSRVRFNEDDALHLDLLLVVNESLIRLYPPAPEDHILAMSILDGVAHIISSLDEKNVARLLSSLKDGLCIWIRDDNKSLLEQEHNILVRIYLVSLNKLMFSQIYHLDPRHLLCLPCDPVQSPSVSRSASRPLTIPRVLI